jgi:hypothetical protein
MTIAPAHTIFVLFCGATNAPGNESPFGVFSLSGVNKAGIWPAGNIGTGELRLHLERANVEEVTGSADTDFFKNGVTSTGDYWVPSDYRQRLGAASWDNAGAYAATIDNGYWFAASGFATRFTSGDLNCVVLGARLSGTGTPEGFFKGTVAAMPVFNRVLTANDFYVVQGLLRYVQPGTKNVLIAGDSMSALNGNAGSNAWPETAWSYEQFGPELGQPPWDTFTPVWGAHSGAASWSYDATAFKNWFGNYGANQFVKEVDAYVWIGINDIGQGYSPAGTYGNVQSIWSEMRGLGAKITAFMLPGVGSEATNYYVSGYYLNGTARTNYNALIRGNPALYNNLVDLEYAFPASAMETNHVPQLSVDGLHMTQAGNSNVAVLVKGCCK